MYQNVSENGKVSESGILYPNVFEYAKKYSDDA